MEINEIEKEILIIQKEMNELTETRESAQVNLTSLKSRLNQGKLPTHHYKQVMDAKIEFKNQINSILSKYRILKLKKDQLNYKLNELKLNQSPNDVISVKQDLQDLKDKYFEFYRDKSRIASMRNMAKQFVIDIDKVIKKS
tara:strand:- start:267 stop:689 length:423 start_codon:yes stop_codon:yes gene_type:complete